MEQHKIAEGIKKLREQLESEKPDNTKIKDISYYEKFELLPSKGKFYGLDSSTYFVNKQEEGKEPMLELYNGSGILIGQVGKIGKIEFSEEYKEYLVETFGEFSDKFGIEERDIFLNKIKDEKTGELDFAISEGKPMEKLEEMEQEEIKEKTEKNKDNKFDSKETEVLEDDLGLDRGDIESSTKIKDPRVKELVPDAKKYDYIGLVYVKGENTFMMVGVKDGKTEKIDKIEPAKGIDSTIDRNNIVSSNRDGSKVKRDPHVNAVMKIQGNTEYSFSVKKGQYGVIELNELRRDPATEQYISTPIGTEHQYPVTQELEDFRRKGSNEDIGNEIENFEMHEKEHTGYASIDEIRDGGAIDKEEEEMEDEEEMDGERGRTIHDHGNKYYH